MLLVLKVSEKWMMGVKMDAISAINSGVYLERNSSWVMSLRRHYISLISVKLCRSDSPQGLACTQKNIVNSI